jgi:hypothetical protein
VIILLPALHFKHEISSLDRLVGRGGEVFILEFFVEKQDK